MAVSYSACSSASEGGCDFTNFCDSASASTRMCSSASCACVSGSFCRPSFSAWAGHDLHGDQIIEHLVLLIGRQALHLRITQQVLLVQIELGPRERNAIDGGHDRCGGRGGRVGRRGLRRFVAGREQRKRGNQRADRRFQKYSHEIPLGQTSDSRQLGRAPRGRQFKINRGNLAKNRARVRPGAAGPRSPAHGFRRASDRPAAAYTRRCRASGGSPPNASATMRTRKWLAPPAAPACPACRWLSSSMVSSSGASSLTSRSRSRCAARCAAGRAGHGGAASEGTRRILLFSQSTCGIMNTTMAALMPNTLNFTHTLSSKFRAT